MDKTWSQCNSKIQREMRRATVFCTRWILRIWCITTSRWTTHLPRCYPHWVIEHSLLPLSNCGINSQYLFVINNLSICSKHCSKLTCSVKHLSLSSALDMENGLYKYIIIIKLFFFSGHRHSDHHHHHHPLSPLRKNKSFPRMGHHHHHASPSHGRTSKTSFTDHTDIGPIAEGDTELDVEEIDGRPDDVHVEDVKVVEEEPRRNVPKVGIHHFNLMATVYWNDLWAGLSIA